MNRQFSYAVVLKDRFIIKPLTMKQTSNKVYVAQPASR